MAKVYSIEGVEKGEVKLPRVFHSVYRPDLIQRAVAALQSARRQPHGTDWFAGKRTSAHYHGVKDKRGSMKNREIARGPRSINTNPGQEMRVRFVPHSKGGRAAHPPKADKIFLVKINEKEAKLATASAIAATTSKELLQLRGHTFHGHLPLVIEDKMEQLKKSSEVLKLVEKLKLDHELDRTAKRKLRAGKGKARGRRYRTKKSFMIVVGEDKGISKAARNLRGVDVTTADNLNAEMLAPGSMAGRLVLWSENAIKKLGELYG